MTIFQKLRTMTSEEINKAIGGQRWGSGGRGATPELRDKAAWRSLNRRHSLIKELEQIPRTKPVPVDLIKKLKEEFDFSLLIEEIKLERKP